MSLINQVLNELEKRGANAPQGGEAIRAIPPRQPSHALRYLLLAAVLLAALAMLALMRYSEPGATPTQLATAPAAIAVLPASAAASAPIEAAALEASGVASSDSLYGKPLLQVAGDEPTATAPAVAKGPRGKQHATLEPVVASDDEGGSAFEGEIKKVSPQQRAESEYRKANLAVQEGRANDALAGYESALLIDPYHRDARLAWAGLLVNLKRNDEAERVLQRGVKRDPRETAFAMLLARLQVERGDSATALKTLQKALPHAGGQAEYLAFVAALLQRLGRHEEAVAQFRSALRLVPGNGIWLMGLGISLQAQQRNDEARDAYQKALDSNGLNAQLQDFVQKKLKEL